MRLVAKTLVILCPVALSVSCASMFQSQAKVIKKLPGQGGEIAIYKGMDGETNARNQAKAYMQETCGAKQYQITEEGEVVVGQVTNSRSDSSASSNFRNISGSSSSETSNKTEWRIKYQCGQDVASQS